MVGAVANDLVDDDNLNDLSLYMRACGETLMLSKDLARMTEQSPMTRVDDICTPLLLLLNTVDVRVPFTQQYRLMKGLRTQKREVCIKLWLVAARLPFIRFVLAMSGVCKPNLTPCDFADARLCTCRPTQQRDRRALPHRGWAWRMRKGVNSEGCNGEDRPDGQASRM